MNDLVYRKIKQPFIILYAFPIRQIIKYCEVSALCWQASSRITSVSL